MCVAKSMNPANRHHSATPFTQDDLDKQSKAQSEEQKAKGDRKAFVSGVADKSNLDRAKAITDNPYEGCQDKTMCAFTIFVMEARDLIQQGSVLTRVVLKRKVDDRWVYMPDNLDDTQKCTPAMEINGDSVIWMNSTTFLKTPLDSGYTLYLEVFSADKDGREDKFLGQLVILPRIIKATVMSFKDKQPVRVKKKSIVQALVGGGSSPDKNKDKNKPKPVGHVRSMWEKLTSRTNEDGEEEPSEHDLGMLKYIIAPANTNLRQLSKKQMNPSTGGKDMYSRTSINESRNELNFDDDEANAKTIKASLNRLSDEQKKKLAEEEANMSKEEIEKRLVRRERVMKELIATEKSYVDALDAVCDGYVCKLRPGMKELKLTDELVKSLSLNIEMIRGFHEEFFQKLKEQSSVKAILQLSSFLRIYKSYVAEYPKMLDAHTKMKKHKKFTEFSDEAESKLPHGDLMSYLIQPVQRVPRYVLLLKEIQKWTPVTHEEFDDLEECLAAVSVIALEINESKRKLENMSKLMAIQQKIKDEGTKDGFTLIVPHRTLLKQGNEVKMVQAKGMFGSMKVSDRILYLFNDVLVWTNRQQKYKGNMRVGAINVEDKDELSFFISNAQQLTQIKFNDPEMKKDWLTTLSEVIKERQAERKQQMEKKMMRNKSINKGRGAHRQMLKSLKIGEETGDFDKATLEHEQAEESAPKKKVPSIKVKKKAKKKLNVP